MRPQSYWKSIIAGLGLAAIVAGPAHAADSAPAPAPASAPAGDSSATGDASQEASASAEVLQKACPGMAAWTELHAKQQDVQTLEMDLPTQPELRAQLLDMAKEDQDARQEVLGPGKPPLQQNPDGAALLDRVDEKNLALLYKLIAEYDIPTPQAVGRDGIKAFWLLVQHAKDIRLQKRVLQVIATGRRGVPPDEVALLDDRIAVAEGRPQKYGSQFHNDGHDMVPSPIEDEAHLDERRAAMGLPPFEDYRCVIREIYRNPAPGPAPGG